MEATPAYQANVASILSAMIGRVVALSMENQWRYKYYGPPVYGWKNEQEYVDYTFIWIIYANFGILLSIEQLAVAA